MPQPVVAAMAEMAAYTVPLDVLQDAVKVRLLRVRFRTSADLARA